MPADRAPLGGDAGFSLVEALVALVILAFSSIALLRASEGHIGRVGRLETQATAQWVAENRLAEIGLSPRSAGALPREVEMLDRVWRIEQEVTPTEDSELGRVVLRVHDAAAEGPSVIFTGFVDLGSAR